MNTYHITGWLRNVKQYKQYMWGMQQGMLNHRLCVLYAQKGNTNICHKNIWHMWRYKYPGKLQMSQTQARVKPNNSWHIYRNSRRWVRCTKTRVCSVTSKLSQHSCATMLPLCVMFDGNKLSLVWMSVPIAVSISKTLVYDWPWPNRLMIVSTWALPINCLKAMLSNKCLKAMLSNKCLGMIHFPFVAATQMSAAKDAPTLRTRSLTVLPCRPVIVWCRKSHNSLGGVGALFKRSQALGGHGKCGEVSHAAGYRSTHHTVNSSLVTVVTKMSSK